jgi:ABC-type bacteriocin/lantibiotic exporter with double-glycine peptidase domain
VKDASDDVAFGSFAVGVVLDHGRVAESGSHDELMARRGLYADLFTLQSASYA